MNKISYINNFYISSFKDELEKISSNPEEFKKQKYFKAVRGRYMATKEKGYNRNFFKNYLKGALMGAPIGAATGVIASAASRGKIPLSLSTPVGGYLGSAVGGVVQGSIGIEKFLKDKGIDGFKFTESAVEKYIG